MRYPVAPGFSRFAQSLAVLTVVSLLAACDRADADTDVTGALVSSETSDAPPAQTELDNAVPRVAIGPATDLPPNEVGQIMVLEYHRLGEPEGEFRRSRENFALDLQTLYDNGYRPITVRQMIEGDIDLPRGTTPVVFTIDDSSTGQFSYLADGSVDPNSMVGIWTGFSEANPEWENGATWCVLPAADHPSNFFGERSSREMPRAEREEAIRRKVDFLVSNDHEICNHTLYHARLDRATSDMQVQEWIGRGEDSIQVYLPAGYEVVTLALPLGMWPANRELAWRGTHAGRVYEYGGVLEVTGGPNPSPFDVKFDPYSINRVIVAPGALPREIAGFERDTHRRYISDGDPSTISVPEAVSERVDRDRWPERQVRVLE